MAPFFFVCSDEPIETPTLQLTTRLSNRSWLGDADADEDDPFAEIDEEEFGDEADLEANVARDKHARMCSHIVELVEALKPSAPEEELNEACEQLVSTTRGGTEVNSLTDFGFPSFSFLLPHRMRS